MSKVKKILELTTPDGEVILAKVIEQQYSENWGGARKGAGREPLGRKQRNFRLTEEEYARVKEFVKELRKENE